MSDIDDTLKERGTRYGEFPDHAEITQGIKRAMAHGRNWRHLPDDMKEALEMVAHKVGRILNGDPNYLDSWTDIIGYSRLVEKRLVDDQERPKDNPSVFAPSTGGDKRAAILAEFREKIHAEQRLADLYEAKGAATQQAQYGHS